MTKGHSEISDKGVKLGKTEFAKHQSNNKGSEKVQIQFSKDRKNN